MNHIMNHATCGLSDRLLELSIMSSRFIHVAACVNTLFPLTIE